MNIQVLERNPYPQRSPTLSPAAYFGAWRPAQVGGIYDMGLAPELGVMGSVCRKITTQVGVYKILSSYTRASS